ncbi:MAG TPA: AlkA N-terminal domain-containing protein [Patescibacteria group bacterium]|nr:AlkA N-terminal domain-containing protein [Patescibacteria group bacterium]
MHRPASLDPARCERARLARDARFDGLFYTAVKTTGIYCRPVCPAPAPKAANVVYFDTAAAAANAGFRPCLRCRPELSPEDCDGRARDQLADRVLARIHEGALDTSDAEGLADEFGIGERQLRRMFLTRYGVTPQAAAATHRLHIAKQLLTETRLPVVDIAFAAGYASLRRFNQAFAAATGMNPTRLRKTRGDDASAGDSQTLRLAYRPPYDWPRLLAFLRARVLPGIERVEDDAYERALPGHGPNALLRVSQDAAHHALNLHLRSVPTKAIPALVQRVRRMFDLDADPQAIASVLSRDPRLRTQVAARPGLRVPVGFDAWETAVRAVVGQRISVAATRTLLSRLIDASGRFPSAAELLDREVGSIGLTQARVRTIRALASAVVQGRVHFRAGQSLDAFVDALVELPGIGPWTAHYIAMRALGHPDAFPFGDLIVRRALGNPTPRAERELVDAWRPWRSYVVLHLWTEASEP